MARRGSSKLAARDLARQILRRVRVDNAYASLALSAALRGPRAPAAADRHLATELVYGVLRQRRRLDHALERHLRLPLARLDPDVQDTLRLAAYQLLLLDRIPAYAAIDDAVGEVRRARGPRLAGVANAVLRKLAPEDLERDLPDDPVARLAITGSVPDELARRWIAQLGPNEAAQLAQALLERPPLTARVNALRVNTIEELIGELEAEGAQVTRGALSPWALRLSGLSDPGASASFLGGRWTVQDEAAQLAAWLLSPIPGEEVVDLCAGLGGKATQLAELMGDLGDVLAVDISARKLELLTEHCLRLGIRSCRTVQADASDRTAWGQAHPGQILLDAPCSGLGVLRRHPELKWRLRPAALPSLVALQRQLLQSAAAALPPGGQLVYSVCTTTDQEGPDQIRWLLEQQPEIELDPPSGGVLAELAQEGLLRLWPHRQGTDGFFLARLRRRPTASGSRVGAPPKSTLQNTNQSTNQERADG